MLDSNERMYQIGPQSTVLITAADMLDALRVPEPPQSPTYDFIRDAFDTLYYYVDRLEHFIQVGLTSFEDISSPLDYYVDYLAEDKDLHASYIALTRYTRVRKFLERFDNWRNPRAVDQKAPTLGLPAARRGIGSSHKSSPAAAA
jgi:hypothetical protein